MALIVVNGQSFPTPIRGLTEVISTNVNSGRNANGEMVGERVGRDILKLDNVEWRWLTKAQWASMLQAVSGFKFRLTVPDVVNGGFITRTCYVGDRTCEPYYINSEGDFTFYRSCKMNFIDCGYTNED
jgi:hypothetical protein